MEKVTFIILLITSLGHAEKCSVFVDPISNASFVGECYSYKKNVIFQSPIGFSCINKVSNKKYEKISSKNLNSILNENGVKNILDLPKCLED